MTIVIAQDTCPFRVMKDPAVKGYAWDRAGEVIALFTETALTRETHSRHDERRSRGYSSVGRALQWHCRGQRFESA
jgi:hypothetical protein